MIQRIRFVVAVLWVMVATSGAAGAQVTTGTIVGAVRDANGVVPGAAVTIREVNKGTADSYVADETGIYTAPFLAPGTYTVEVNVQGFRKWRRKGSSYRSISAREST
jgi:Carboxypeptidase regulatory-like domain